MLQLFKRCYSIQKVGVVGAGQMGIGIALVAALAKKSVCLVDQSPKQLEKGSKFIGMYLGIPSRTD
jgi:3-hydroxybutyryl-CoA dehydrogenase